MQTEIADKLNPTKDMTDKLAKLSEEYWTEQT
jgi:hypothetical protein